MDLTTYVEKLRGDLAVAAEAGRAAAPPLPARLGEPPAAGEAPPPPEGDATARINLRLPEQLKADVEQAASRERLSVNAWLIRAAAAAIVHGDPARRAPLRGGRLGDSYTGWVR